MENSNRHNTITLILPYGRETIHTETDDLTLNIQDFLIKYLNSDNTFNCSRIYITSSTKLISRYETVNNLIKTGFVTLEIHPTLDGGGGLIDMFMGIIKIGEFFSIIPDIIIWLGKTILWLFQFIPWFLGTFLNPMSVGKDIVGALMTIMTAILMIPIDLFFALTQYGAMTLGNMMSSIWGWDQSNLTEEDKKSNYFKDSQNCNDKKYYLGENNTVPFSVLLGTIVCPPMGVFMVYGFTGWINIFICLALTMLFYFPGLFYALLIVYN